jgi:hypothetical protein
VRRRKMGVIATNEFDLGPLVKVLNQIAVAYAHLQLDPVRAVADRTARKLAGALAGSGDAGNVVRLVDKLA